MTSDPTLSRAGLHPVARELILAAQHGQRADFGTRYGQLLDNPDFDQITADVLATLRLLVLGWVSDQGGGGEPEAAINAIHQRVSAAYPGCLHLLGINLVVLEQLARSTVGLSGLLSGLDGSFACLYAALLVGCSLSEPAGLAELADLADRSHD